ncbi:MAG: cyclase family protein [Candidatus Polarisedimenticolia bacterium]
MRARPQDRPAGRRAVTGIAVAAAFSIAACTGPPPPPLPGAAELLARAPAERLLDLSYSYDASTLYWPASGGFRLTVDAAGRTPSGSFYASNSLCTSEHGGTHLDAPYHFAEGGATTDRIPIGALVGPLFVLDVREACAADPDHAVTEAEIRAFEARHGAIPEGAIVVLFTGWGVRWPDAKRYLGDDTPGDATRLHFPGLSAEGARYLATRRIAGAGIDTASIDPGPSRDFPAHQVLAASGIYTLENLDNVERLPPAGAALVALPMKIGGGTGGPARVLAVLP